MIDFEADNALVQANTEAAAPASPAAPWSAEDKALDDEITAYLDEILPEDELGSIEATERWVHPTPRPAPQQEA